MHSLVFNANEFSVYIFSCKHARTYHAAATATCLRTRARVRSLIRTSPSAASKRAAPSCPPRSRRLPFHSPPSLRNKTKPKIYWGSTAVTRERAKAHAGKVVTGVPARITGKQCVLGCAQCTFHTPTCLVKACSCSKKPPAEPAADGLVFPPTPQRSASEHLSEPRPL
jgi:hypothetical protein